MKDSYTISFWGITGSLSEKKPWGFANGNKLSLYSKEEYFFLNTNTSSTNIFVNSVGNNLKYSPYVSEEHHFVITGDGQLVSLYIDGVKVGQARAYVPITGTSLIISGDSATNVNRWNGYFSDFRLYATALSAAAVKDLYESSIAFLDNGTLQCGEIIERDENIKYNKNSIVQTKEIIEADTNLKLYADKIQTYQIYEL